MGNVQPETPAGRQRQDTPLYYSESIFRGHGMQRDVQRNRGALSVIFDDERLDYADTSGRGDG